MTRLLESDSHLPRGGPEGRLMVLMASENIETRDQQVIRDIVDKGMTLRATGKLYNISHERARQIVTDAGYSVSDLKRQRRIAPTRLCGVCKKEYEPGSYDEHCRVAQHRQLIPPGEKVERNQQIVYHYVFGKYNTTEIAEAFDIPQPIVTRVLHREGIRPSGRRRRKGGLVEVVKANQTV